MWMAFTFSIKSQCMFQAASRWTCTVRAPQSAPSRAATRRASRAWTRCTCAGRTCTCRASRACTRCTCAGRACTCRASHGVNTLHVRWSGVHAAGSPLTVIVVESEAGWEQLKGEGAREEDQMWWGEIWYHLRGQPDVVEGDMISSARTTRCGRLIYDIIYISLSTIGFVYVSATASTVWNWIDTNV